VRPPLAVLSRLYFCSSTDRNWQDAQLDVTAETFPRNYFRSVAQIESLLSRMQSVDRLVLAACRRIGADSLWGGYTPDSGLARGSRRIGCH
jgi:hypothetical protein